MYVEGDIYFDVVEFERIDYFKPLKTYDECGIKVSCNSDVTSAHYNPFLGMYAAVARKTSQGRSLGKTERIDRKTMLRMFTINGAYFAFNDHQIGSIEVGKLADMAVLSDDIYTVAEEDILNMSVTMTVIDGKIVYQA
jgi:predicted amidohydrolase YtcJ